MATLKEFLTTGRLGPIHPGMTEAEVTRLLGSPQDESVERHPKILKYGGLQLTFLRQPNNGDKILSQIGLYFSPTAQPIPEATLPADLNVTPKTTSFEIRGFLDRAGLQGAELVADEETNYITVPSGARFTFDGQALHSIHFTTPAPRMAKKQISVSIPKDIWNELTTLARESHQSIGEMCAEWITQRASQFQHDGAGECGSAPII